MIWNMPPAPAQPTALVCKITKEQLKSDPYTIAKLGFNILTLSDSSDTPSAGTISYENIASTVIQVHFTNYDDIINRTQTLPTDLKKARDETRSKLLLMIHGPLHQTRDQFTLNLKDTQLNGKTTGQHTQIEGQRQELSRIGQTIEIDNLPQAMIQQRSQ